MLQAAGIYIIIIVVAGTMFNIFLLIAALRVICRRCSSDQSSEHSLSSDQARADEEAPRLKQPSPTVVLQPDNQVAMARKLSVEPLEVERQQQEAAPSRDQRQCWVVSVPLERRSKSSVA
ncbi:hypothetical protein CVIRNUC_009138 [Coccomyxa viridis]|uniref:Uncharacterized protein n=1 Tax=Coccomyxa viridis TaxID=1274662 RepID=A0AAV1II82_9CHLO|nr:hypothetical protein CVIRNUC_009138 [Coccomyxa viridis]